MSTIKTKTGWNKNKLKKALKFWQAKKNLGDVNADGWITKIEGWLK